MCRPKGLQWFLLWAFLVGKRVYTLPILVWNPGMVFEGTTGVYERIYRFNSKPIREIEICEFEMHLKNCFVCHNFCLKVGSENGYGFLRFRARFSKVPIINGPVKLFGFT